MRSSFLPAQPDPRLRAQIAWLLLILFGWLGLHRAFLGQRTEAATIPMLVLPGMAALPSGPGAGALLLAGLWIFTDLFRLPGLIAAEERRRNTAPSARDGPLTGDGRADAVTMRTAGARLAG